MSHCLSKDQSLAIGSDYLQTVKTSPVHYRLSRMGNQNLPQPSSGRTAHIWVKEAAKVPSRGFCSQKGFGIGSIQRNVMCVWFMLGFLCKEHKEMRMQEGWFCRDSWWPSYGSWYHSSAIQHHRQVGLVSIWGLCSAVIRKHSYGAADPTQGLSAELLLIDFSCWKCQER